MAAPIRSRMATTAPTRHPVFVVTLAAPSAIESTIAQPLRDCKFACIWNRQLRRCDGHADVVGHFAFTRPAGLGCAGDRGGVHRVSVVPSAPEEERPARE